MVRPFGVAPAVMHAFSLFVVSLVARTLVVWDRTLPLSAWTPLAFIWQDAAICLAFALVERLLRSPRVQSPGDCAVRLAYASLVALAVVNVPIVRVLSSPLTVPMLRAARGTLADSIAYHATAANLAATAIVAAAGLLAPFACRGIARRVQIAEPVTGIWIGLVAIAITGRIAAAHIDTAGLERHPLAALIGTSIPRVAAEPRDIDWRATAIANPPDDADLTPLVERAAGRNVLLVVLESTAARYLRAYGAREDPTPTLTALAARSLVFEHAYAVYPESVKGLPAILASRYPAFDVPAARHAPAMSPSLASVLGAAGYDTALFHSGRFMYLGMDALVARAGFGRLEDAGDIGGHRESSFGIDEAAAVARVLAWIDTPRGNRPFFAAYLPIAGHHPYAHATPAPFADDDDLGRYRNALAEGDRALGALVDGLRSRGLDRSTLVIVAGDHGEAFGQHEGNYGHTLALFEENVRVPLVIALPTGLDRASVGVRARRIASLVDVAPTVLDLLGVDRPASFQGRSLLRPGAALALFFTDYSLGLLGLRDGCLKYLYEIEADRSKLFDLCRDPDERVDVAARYPDLVPRYRERLRQWSAAAVADVGGT